MEMENVGSNKSNMEILASTSIAPNISFGMTRRVIDQTNMLTTMWYIFWTKL